MSYEEWNKREVEKALTGALKDLEAPERFEPVPLRKSRSHQKWTLLDISSEQHFHFESKEQGDGLIHIDTLDPLVIIIAIIICFIPIWQPVLQISYLFGLSLLFALITRSTLIKVVILFLTVLYFTLAFLLLWPYESAEVWALLVGENTISLVPAAIGTAFILVAMVLGGIYGIAGRTSYAGATLLSLTLIICLTETIIDVFILNTPNWLLGFVSRTIVYAIVLLTAWGLTFLPFRLIRAGITRLRYKGQRV
ncbi:MAG: hypothetical protein ACTSRL_14370 [Candidatus Helarchaeota archaeon]|nr:hypothetical protein [Deltaproteobacteria bacterium]